MWIIGDVHGCYEELVELLKQIPKEDKICFVGDLIDRGPDSYKVIELIKNNNYDCVLGNHEDMLLEVFNMKQPRLFGTDFMRNGGGATLLSYVKSGIEPKDLDIFNTLDNLDLDKFNPHLEFLRNLPLYKEYDIKDEKGRKLIVSHSCLIGLEKNRIDFNEQVLWNRNIFSSKKEDWKDYFNVFGHTPIFYLEEDNYIKKKYKNNFQNGIFIDEELGFANIDTGLVYKHKLTAFHFPSKKIIQVDKK